jgi:hypothetical protein
LYATLCWCTATVEPVPDALTERLHQPGECAEPVDRGPQWKWDLAVSHPQNPASGSMPGSAMAASATCFYGPAAHKAIGEARFLKLVEGAAWHVWETPGVIGNFCCGMAGQADALLNLYRHTGDAIWLRRARETASRVAVASANLQGRCAPAELDARPESLYKGDLASQSWGPIRGGPNRRACRCSSERRRACLDEREIIQRSWCATALDNRRISKPRRLICIGKLRVIFSTIGFAPCSSFVMELGSLSETRLPESMSSTRSTRAAVTHPDIPIGRELPPLPVLKS